MRHKRLLENSNPPYKWYRPIDLVMWAEKEGPSYGGTWHIHRVISIRFGHWIISFEMNTSRVREK